MRHACLDIPGNISPDCGIADRGEYSPVGNCHFLATALALTGTILGISQAKKAAKQEKQLVASEIEANKNSSEYVAALEAANVSLAKENQDIKLGYASPWRASNLFDPKTGPTEAAWLIIGIAALALIAKKEIF